MGLAHARPPRVRPHRRASRSPPARSARASPTASAWRIAEQLAAGPLRRRAVRPPHLRDLRRRRPRRRASATRPRRSPATSASAGSSTSTTTTTSPSTAPPSWPSPTTPAKRFEAYGWHVEDLGEVANDLDALEAGAPAGAWRSRTAPSLHRAAQPHRLPVARPTPTPRTPTATPFGADEIARHQGGPRPAPTRPSTSPTTSLDALPRRPARRGRDGARGLGEAPRRAATGDREAELDACLAGTGPARLGRRRCPSWEPGDKVATRRRQRQRASTPLADVVPGLVGRRRRPHRQHRHASSKGRRRAQSADEPGRPPDPLRRPRARHGRRSMNGMAAPRRRAARRRHVLRVQRLHAARGAPRRAVAAPRSSSRGPTTRSASARTAPPTSRSSTSPSLRAMPGPARDPPGRRQRDRRGLAARHRARRARPP